MSRIYRKSMDEPRRSIMQHFCGSDLCITCRYDATKCLHSSSKTHDRIYLYIGSNNFLIILSRHFKETTNCA